MSEPQRCALGHDEPNRLRYEATIKEPGKDAQKIVCCRNCAMAIYERKADWLPKDATDKDLVTQLERQFPDRNVEIPEPQKLRETPSVERSIGLNPPGYDPGRKL